MLGMSRLLSSRQPKPCCPFITHLDQTVKSNQQFMQTIQDWRTLEINYMGQLIGLQSKIRDRMQQSASKADGQLLSLFDIVVKCHKNMITKINQEIFQTCFSTFSDIIERQKAIIKQEKSNNKNFVSRKEQLAKLRQKEQTFRKSLAEELIQQIFTHNSISQCSNKLKIVQKVEDLYQKQDEQDLKIHEARQTYAEVSKKSKENVKRFDSFQQSFVIQTLQVLKKAANSINLFAESLSADTGSYIANRASPCCCGETLSISQGLEKFESEYEQVLNVAQKGYLQTTVELIKNHSIDQLSEYAKDKETKRKIKSVIDSNEVSPECTDQITRQVQLVKKMIRTKEVSLMEQFKTIINKSSRFRMNFVFMLQLYRINSQFEMTETQIEPIIILINEILKTSHQKKDVYVLKHIIILLLTYFITVRVDECDYKVYILHFFKKNKFWRDLQLWESMLIESIYTQKKSTIRMLLTTSCVSDKTELAAAEKTLILNQILYVVRNMLLFDFVEKEVKQFVNRFVKLLKQDDKFAKQVYKSIEMAIKQEEENRQPDLSVLQKHSFCQIIQNDTQL